MGDFDVFTEVLKKTQEELRNMKKANILIVGKTGVGKSTLINNIFREEMAETGIGKPVTQHLKKISKEGIPINLYDTKGLELNKNIQEEIKEEILDEIDRCNNLCIQKDDQSELIHVCWYCMDSPTSRCEDTDIEWIKDIAKKIPVIIVITKGFPRENAKKFKKEIENLNLDCRGIIPILAQQYEDRDEDDENDIIIIPSYGLDKLVEVTYQVLPEGVKRSFNNAQKVSIDKKVQEARGWILAYIGGSGAIGLSPIPFSDAPLLAAAQLSMIAHITTIFGLPVEKALLTSIISSIAGITGATLTGKTLVANLFKLIPGAGTIAGGLISATIAATITTAVGMAYINVLKYLLEEEAKGNNVSTDMILEKMTSELKKEMKINMK